MILLFLLLISEPLHIQGYTGQAIELPDEIQSQGTLRGGGALEGTGTIRIRATPGEHIGYIYLLEQEGTITSGAGMSVTVSVREPNTYELTTTALRKNYRELLLATTLLGLLATLYALYKQKMRY